MILFRFNKKKPHKVFIFQTLDWLYEGLGYETFIYCWTIIIYNSWLVVHYIHFNVLVSLFSLLLLLLWLCVHIIRSVMHAYDRANNANCYWCADLFAIHRHCTFYFGQLIFNAYIFFNIFVFFFFALLDTFSSDLVTILQGRTYNL